MLEPLISLITDPAHWTLNWIPHMARLPVHEGGVKISGARVKKLEHGMYYWIPNLTLIFTDNVKRKSRALENQTLTTSDEKTVRVGGVLEFSVENIVTWLVENEDPDQALLVQAGRVLRQWVEKNRFERIHEFNPDKRRDDELTRLAQAELGSSFGVRVRLLGMSDFAMTQARDFSITGGQPVLVDEEEEA
jgi:hypothetical protein